MNEKTQLLTPEQKKMDIFDIPPHPAAEVFPMLDDDELEELASDIKNNGLQHPLVVAELGDEPLLVDGRNRREACRRVGVIPDYIRLDGHDPVAYILSANINRRHMTKGQRAMAVAKIYPDRTPRGQSSVSEGITYERVSSARTVLRHAPDLADQVITGSLSLDKAYEEAKIRKGQVDLYDYRFNFVKRDGPDLAELVIEGQLTLEEAEAALRQRQELGVGTSFLPLKHSTIWQDMLICSCLSAMAK
jgi:ParB-like nuclease domain